MRNLALLSVAAICLWLLSEPARSDPPEESPAGYKDAPAAAQPAPRVLRPRARAVFSNPDAVERELPAGRVPQAVDAPFQPAPAEAKENVPPGYADAPRRAPAGAAPGNLAGAVILGDPGFNPQRLETYLRAEGERVLEIELELAAGMFDLKPQQRSALTALANEHMAERLRSLLQSNPAYQPERGTLPRTFLKVRDMAETAMAAAVNEELSAQQSQRYLSEIDERRASYQRVCVLNIVIKLDEDLFLTAEQRDKLVESLSANWKPEWRRGSEVWMRPKQRTAWVPEEIVLPILDETQSAAWRALRSADTSSPGYTAPGGGALRPNEVRFDRVR